MSRKSKVDAFIDYYVTHCGYEYISGKFFDREKKEVKNIEKKVGKICLLKTGTIPTNAEVQRILDGIILLSNEENKIWYDLPYIEKAEELIKTGAELKAPIVLTKKQLMIINALLNNKDPHFFIIQGCGGSGKSTFLNLVRQCFENDAMNCGLEDLKDQSKLYKALSSRLISSDEIGSDFIDNQNIKKICTRNLISVRQIYSKASEIKAQSKMIFSCNVAPSFDLSDPGMLRRIIYYVMDTPISKPIYGLDEKEFTEEEIINTIALALKTPFDEKEFMKETFELLQRTNSVALYMKRNTKEKSYIGYLEYCENFKIRKPVGEPKFYEIYDRIEEMRYKIEENEKLKKEEKIDEDEIEKEVKEFLEELEKDYNEDLEIEDIF